MPSFIKENWLVVCVFALACLAAIWFAISLVLDVVYFNDPMHQDEALKAWMTPRYVVESYHLPLDVVAEALDLPKGGPRGRSVGEIAQDMDLTLDELTQRVRDAAAMHRANSE